MAKDKYRRKVSRREPLKKNTSRERTRASRRPISRKSLVRPRINLHNEKGDRAFFRAATRSDIARSAPGGRGRGARDGRPLALERRRTPPDASATARRQGAAGGCAGFFWQVLRTPNEPTPWSRVAHQATVGTAASLILTQSRCAQTPSKRTLMARPYAGKTPHRLMAGVAHPSDHDPVVTHRIAAR